MDSGNIFELEATGGDKSLDVRFEGQGGVESYSGSVDYRKQEVKKEDMADRHSGILDSREVTSGQESFMWSYEKVHLSMMQVITGKLVECFDEEFRTLYARSSIPVAFGQEVSVSEKHKKTPWENGSYQNSLSSLLSASSQRSLGWKEPRGILDSSYLKARSRFVNNEEEKFNTRNVSSYRGFNVQNKINQFQQFDRNENWKRHSYAAGEKTDATPYSLLNA
ncbi:unnamed protein product [Ranitomeya imitator]|uniref:Scaffolding anchor of CK1 domain-containing protein n=1 Tax=Ranitomeya imitator TaxID=111125 RepID=A0ABN9LZP4_9NEOB|nr:unnamed protein product [Ranitomeya imitator]